MALARREETAWLGKKRGYRRVATLLGTCWFYRQAGLPEPMSLLGDV